MHEPNSWYEPVLARYAQTREKLLRSCEWASSGSTFLDMPATQFAASIIEKVEQHPVDLVALQAELAGRYTIERELGRGGNGDRVPGAR